MFIDLPVPAVIAHRGASLFAPENTQAAFDLAIRQHADAVELDVQCCASGEIVVFHDSKVDRTTNGTGRIKDMSWAALQELDAGSWFDSAFKGEKILSLDQVFDQYGKKVLINVELKNLDTPFDRLAENVALLVKRHQVEKNVFFSSFNPLAIRKIKRLLPMVPVGFLTVSGFSLGWLERLVGWFAPYDTLNPHHSDVSPQFMKRARRAQKLVFTYTVDDESEMRRLIDLGVNGFFTNDPIKGRQVVQS